jgi:hypothetical protein
LVFLFPVYHRLEKASLYFIELIGYSCQVGKQAGMVQHGAVVTLANRQINPRDCIKWEWYLRLANS